MKSKVLVGAALALALLGLVATFGRYEYLGRPGPPLRVDRFTGRTYMLRVNADGGAAWVPLRTPEEAHEDAVKAWGTPAPPASPH